MEEVLLLPSFEKILPGTKYSWSSRSNFDQLLPPLHQPAPFLLLLAATEVPVSLVAVATVVWQFPIRSPNATTSNTGTRKNERERERERERETPSSFPAGPPV